MEAKRDVPYSKNNSDSDPLLPCTVLLQTQRTQKTVTTMDWSKSLINQFKEIRSRLNYLFCLVQVSMVFVTYLRLGDPTIRFAMYYTIGVCVFFDNDDWHR